MCFPVLLVRLLVACCLLILPACVGVSVPHGPDGLPLQPFAVSVPKGIFAATTDRTLLAYADDGLLLFDITSKRHRQIDPRPPLLLGWRHDGAQLAAVFAEEGEERVLALFDREGRHIEESVLPGVPIALAWSRQHDLLVAGYTLRHFSFGSSLSQWLVRIGADGREQLKLGDATLKPATNRNLGGKLAALLAVSFSASGDELVYARLHDPPQFPAYLQLVHRNWQVASERQLVQLPLYPVTLHWVGEGEVIGYGGAESRHTLALWPDTGTFQPVAVPVAAPASAWGADAQLQRFANGDFLLATGGRLYAGTGLPASPPAAAGAQAWTLRKWRFEGLITPQEYREVRP